MDGGAECKFYLVVLTERLQFMRGVQRIISARHEETERERESESERDCGCFRSVRGQVKLIPRSVKEKYCLFGMSSDSVRYLIFS